MSRPPRARGLKRLCSDCIEQRRVAPPAGAWIETMLLLKHKKIASRAPRGRVD